MACSKHTFSVPASFTAIALAEILRQAFTTAGLMSDWHASFSVSSLEHRVLKLEYDAGKAYGTTYYWFIITSLGIYLSPVTGWDTVNNVPVGQQYLDYISTATDTQANHWEYFYLSSGFIVTISVYVSGVDSRCSWFVVTQSGLTKVFTFAHPQSPLPSWLNLDRGFFAGFAQVTASVSDAMGRIRFKRGPALRRDLMLGTGLNGTTSLTTYNSTSSSQDLLCYTAPGNRFNNTTNFNIIQPYIFLPVGFPQTNPAYLERSNPIYHSLPYTPYLVDPLPSDFGITFHYATNTFSPGDAFVVTLGVEEWEVVMWSSNTWPGEGASPLFLARMI